MGQVVNAVIQIRGTNIINLHPELVAFFHIYRSYGLR
jgi:hypothetical protein